MPMRSRKSGTGSSSDADSMICRSPMNRVPTSGFASCTSTARPARARTIAAARPDGPAPAIRMGGGFVMRSGSPVPRLPGCAAEQHRETGQPGNRTTGVSYRAVSDANSVAAPARPRRFGGYAALVAAGILLSRIAGLVRTSVFAHYLGASAAADAFNVALKVPNFLQNLLGEGVLSASFIPVYSRLLARGEQKAADRVAGVFVSFLVLIVTAIVILGVFLTPLILSVTAAGLEPPVMALAVKYTRIIFP